MKIGIDAKWYHEGPVSGQRVVKNLVDHLVRISGDVELYLIFDKQYRFSNPALPPHVHPIYVWAGNNLLSNLLVLPFVARKHRLDAILFQYFAAPFGDYKKIAYIHDIFFTSHKSHYSLLERLYFSPIRFLSNRADHIVTISNAEKDRMIRHGYKTDISVVYHGVDDNFATIDSFSQRQVETIRDQYQLPNKYLLFVGRINSRKNISNLIRAVRYLEDKTLKLVVVGKRDWKVDRYQALLQDKDLKERILFTGGVDDTALAAIYAMAWAFCFPSFAEAFGLPALEAMKSGIPVVVSDSTCLPEICGPAAVYVDPHSPQDIARGINQLSADPRLYNEKKQLALAQAKKFNWSTSAQTLLNVIHALRDGG